MNSSSSEKKKKKANQLIDPVLTYATLWQFTASSEWTIKTATDSYFSGWRTSFSCPFFFLSKSAPVSSGLSTRRHVGKFLQSPNANITDAQRHSSLAMPFQRATAFFSRDTFFFFFLPGPTAVKRVHPHSGQVERWKGGDGIQSEVSSCTAQHGTAQQCTAPPLHSSYPGRN